MRQHDVILFGATGFTGGLVAQVLARHPELEVRRWAIAGRDVTRLASIRERLAARDPRLAGLAIYQASTDEPESLADLAVRTRVLLTTVGPYQRLGRPVVQACVDAGTDYVDLTGEPEFWTDIASRHHDQAVQTDTLIVPCCGFDSIPADLGAWLCLRALAEHDGVGAGDGHIELDGYVAARGRASGGTWQSAVGLLAAFGRRDATAADDGLRDRTRARQRIHREASVGRWVVPLPTIDPLVVQRTMSLSPDLQVSVVYRHWLETKSGRQAARLVALAAGALALAKLRPTRALLAAMRSPGSGPAPEERNRNWFRVKVLGRQGERTASATISGGDPGYDETAKMIAEAALCLAHDRPRLAMRGGVATPASAMGDALVQRLRRAGLTIEVTPAAPAESVPQRSAASGQR